MEENPYKSPEGDLPKPKPPRRPASWPTVIGSAGGIEMAATIAPQLAGGLDLGGPIWTLTLTLSLVFGAMAGGLVADYVRKRR